MGGRECNGGNSGDNKVGARSGKRTAGAERFGQRWEDDLSSSHLRLDLFAVLPDSACEGEDSGGEDSGATREGEEEEDIASCAIGTCWNTLSM